jgi:hypothetical protein
MTQKPPWVVIAGLVASGTLDILVQALGKAIPSQAALIANVVGVLVAIATILLAYYQAANATAPSVLQDAPVVNAAGVQVGTNVSTTSTAPIAALQKA